ncbi:hypothetical protein G647_06702 [Cladophialophora carrionii CBS 160.54]|uniref:NmrA-like domain-containing protein n=1 Tax=Cladophialophora carrionii CBS 160.54 TaxID=1279043 RepID=V9D7I8_9EURO|nr:uncharacterized protein G647_06702 [Cladophialophora carrionii CBS 160.54]ETI22626.1 hypothetical protein G647_06702 [Cladophialophora carrionii CBS 160.54]
MEKPFVPSPDKPVIAVAGATGDLGTRLTNTFLSPELRDRLSGFVSLARRHTPSTERWTTLGAEIRIIENECDENDLIMALDGVDVLVNAISSAGTSLRDKLANALPKTSVKLYFPSEFGVDHTLHDFGIPEWDGKKRHYELAKKIQQEADIQICRLFVGLFLHSGIAPWYGFHTSRGVYQAVGSLDQSISYTDISDIARVVCGLAERAVRGERVPEELRIAGSHASFRQIAQEMSAAESGDIDLKTVELDTYRDKALSRKYGDRGAIVCLRFVMGDGRVDYRPKDEGGLGNDNEVVNPGQQHFVWKTVRDLARETGGRPNSDA